MEFFLLNIYIKNRWFVASNFNQCIQTDTINLDHSQTILGGKLTKKCAIRARDWNENSWKIKTKQTIRKKPRWKIWWFDFKMIFSPSAHHRHYFSFHFNSSCQILCVGIISYFGFPNECFGSIFSCSLHGCWCCRLFFVLFSLSHSTLPILRTVDGECRLSFSSKKETLIISLFFSRSACSSCATESIHYTNICTYSAHIKFITIWCRACNENKIEREDGHVCVCVCVCCHSRRRPWYEQKRNRGKKKKILKSGNA